MKKTLRLKYRLEPIGENKLEFHVLKMDEKFRNKAAINLSFRSKNGITVYSDGGPEIDGRSIFLRGKYKEYDRCVEKYTYSSRERRDEAFHKIHAALKEWSVEWFKNK